MWLHIVIFVMTLGFAAACKMGWPGLDGFGDKTGKRLFIAVALTGNLFGLVVTMRNGAGESYPDGHMLLKEESGSYEEKFLVTVDGQTAGSMYVQVPAKETGDEISEEETKELTREEKQMQELKDMVALYNLEHSDPDYYYLPDEWDGKSLEWKQSADHSGNFLAFISLLAAFAVLVKKAREKQEALAKRYEQLLMDYPAFVMKFTLLIQAGMTARKAFQKIAGDYGKRASGKRRYAYEEITAACYEMDSGVSEGEAYRRFGERCAQIKYRTFATLLIQNLQKGSRRMADMLEKESMEAWEDRKRKARVLGEAASTKLLVPMVMMLAVVMAIIMIPAFLSFYGT